MLNLNKPIVFFDLETTGVNVSYDRIVEISLLKLQINKETSIKTLRINPTIPIPPQASAVHGIYQTDIIDCPNFCQVSQEIIDFIGDADLAGFNSNGFDIPLLIEEFIRCGINFSIDNRRCIDVMRIYKNFEKRDLSAAVKFYCNKEMENAHSAEADVKATYEVFLAQLQRYPNDLGNIDIANKISQGEIQYVDTAKRMIWVEGEAIFNFGKHKGKPVSEVLRIEPQYYDWMMKGDFTMHTKMKLTEIKERLQSK